MKKRLLFAALAMFCTVGSFAINVGDYVYSHTAKYKVTSENIVLNGDFNVGDGSEGWLNGDGGAMSAASWKVVTTDVGLGDGINAVVSQGASTDANGTLANKWQLSSGLYVISYSVYAPEDITSSVTEGGTNYVIFFANTTGDNTVERAISGAESWKGEQWTQVVDTIFVNADQEFLVFNANNVSADIKFSQFSINKVTEVYDTRIIDRLIEYAEKLLQEPDLANGRDEFAMIVEMLKEAIQNPENIEDKDAAEALVASFNEAFDAFLNENGGNTVGTTGDWTQISSSGFKGLTTFGAWKFDGGRWGFSANDGNLGLPENDGYVAGAGVQTQWEQTWPAYIESSALEVGKKYFFSIEAKVIPGSSTQIGDNPPYGEDYNYPTVGGENFKMFIGTDTLQMEGETLSGYYWKKFYMIAEVPADADAVRAGWIYHFPVGFAKAARAYLRNPEFRLIGKTEIQINYEAAVKDVYLQQTELKKRIDNYPADVAGYWWAKGLLDEAIAEAMPVYEESLGMVTGENQSSVEVSAEGVDQLRDMASRLLAQVRALNSAKNNVIAENAIFATLENDIAAAKDVLADDLYQDGDKEIFQSVITAAETTLKEMKANSSDATRDADEATMQATVVALAEAVAAFKESAHLTPIIDIDFEDGFSTDDNGNYVVEGNPGLMTFEADQVTEDNAEGGTTYTIGVNGEYFGLLRVGKSNATVEFPEIADDEVVRVSFDMWVGNLVKRYMVVELQNEAGERIAGFKLNRYDAVVDYNDFNNEENTGLDLLSYVTAIGRKGVDNAQICVDDNLSSFELIVDNARKTVKGIVVNGTNGTCIGADVPMQEISDTKVAKFVLSSTYDNADRRSFFDNLKAYKYRHPGGGIQGDVNDDGTVDVADISAIISVMAGTAQYPAADVNGDGTVDVADISNVIAIMAGN